MVCHTPVQLQYLPVISPARVGAQVGPTWKFVRRTLSACIASRVGVWMTGLPWQARSPYP